MKRGLLGLKVDGKVDGYLKGIKFCGCLISQLEKFCGCLISQLEKFYILWVFNFAIFGVWLFF